METIVINRPREHQPLRIYLALKRMFDLIVCILALPIILPVMAVCALAIYLDDPNGPIFFVQERIGKGEKPFRMYKFRTIKSGLNQADCRAMMKAYVRGEIGDDSESDTTYKPIPANQIFRVGRILRKTSLDELPQIINVIKGDMSIIGPRPNVPWEVDAYRPWHYERMEILPGITGLAQVRGRSSIGFNTLVRYDIAYIKQVSLKLDIKIIWWTVKVALRTKGAS